MRSGEIRSDVAMWVLGCWAALALVLAVANQSLTLSLPFRYNHAWISAFFAVEARSFATHGILSLHGIPIANNWPLGSKPEAYPHWPPLFAVILSLAFQAFGESEAVGHGLMLGIFLATGAVLWLLVRDCLGQVAGLVAIFYWLVAPVNSLYAHLVWNLHLAIFLSLLSLVGVLRATANRDHLHRGWATFACGTYSLALLSSWEPALMSPGLIAAAGWLRRPSAVRLGIAYALTGIFTCMLVLGNSAAHYPGQVMEIWNRLLHRLGLTEDYISNALLAAPKQQGRPSLVGALILYFKRHRDYIGWLPLGMLGWLMIDSLEWRRQPERYPLVLLSTSLLSMWLLWSMLFWVHFLEHDCEMVLAVPASALALGWGATSFLCAMRRDDGRSARLKEVAVLLVVPMLLLTPLLGVLHGAVQVSLSSRVFGIVPSVRLREWILAEGEEIGYARDIVTHTSTTAVVITPFESAVPVYYSKRHLVQGIENDAALKEVIDRVKSRFPAPIYVAVPASRREKFGSALEEYEHVAETTRTVLLKVQ